jgi:hypothetical protein
MHHPDTRAELNETAAPPSSRVGHGPHEPRFRKLPRCRYGVYSPSSAPDGYQADCGEPAEYEITWDDGAPPLLACELHARAVEDAGGA